MKKLNLISLFALNIALLGITAYATDNRPYGTGGCGLGSLVMGKDGSQVLAATTNGTSGTQTFGISSGTSNCTDNGTVAANKAVPAYIEANREVLSKDIARGNGEALAGLSHVMGCNDSRELAKDLKKNYREIFPAGNASTPDVTQKMMKIIKSDPALNCRHIS